MFLGAILIILQFAGFPFDWLRFVNLGIGLLVILIGYSQKPITTKPFDNKKDMPFSENRGVIDNSSAITSSTPDHK